MDVLYNEFTMESYKFKFINLNRFINPTIVQNQKYITECLIGVSI